MPENTRRRALQQFAENAPVNELTLRQLATEADELTALKRCIEQRQQAIQQEVQARARIAGADTLMFEGYGFRAVRRQHTNWDKVFTEIKNTYPDQHMDTYAELVWKVSPDKVKQLVDTGHFAPYIYDGLRRESVSYLVRVPEKASRDENSLKEFVSGAWLDDNTPQDKL